MNLAYPLRFVLKILGIALLFGTSANSTQVFANSSRSQPGVSMSTLSAIGQLVCKRGSRRNVSTATVIEDRSTVLGVSHFQIDPQDNSTIPLESCHFQLLDRHGEVIFESKLSLFARGGDGQQIDISRATDWAILALDRPAPRLVHPIQVQSDFRFSRSREVRLVGYSAEYANMQRHFVVSNCEPRFSHARSIVVEHTCRTGPGSSGAPLLATTDNGLVLVAIHTARKASEGLAVSIAGYSAQALQSRARQQRQWQLAAAARITR